MLIMNMENSNSKSRWKRGLSKLRRQSTVSESPEFQSIMEENEDASQKEMQDYLAKLKKKTGLNMLWSGRKFSEAIDRDPDIDISEPVSLLKSTLKDMTLDSDEEDLHKFIQNLTDDEEEIASEKASEKSSDSEIDLMKNINFAEVAAGSYNLEVESDQVDDDDDDYMPRVVKPKFDEYQKDESSSSSSGVFKKNIKFIDSDDISEVSSSSNIKSVIHKTISEVVDNDNEHIEDIEENVESRAKSPAKSTDYNYTESRFDSYDTGNYEQSKDSRLRSSYSKSATDRTISDSDSSYSSSKTSVRLSPYMKHDKNDKSEKSKKKKQYNKDDSTLTSRSSLSSSSRSTVLSRKTTSTKSIDTSRVKKSHDTKRKTHRKDKKSKIKNRSTQTNTNQNFESNLFAENIHLKNDITSKCLDPSPIATTVVSQDALEALTSYNPSVLALNDLLKFQLQLTRQRIDNSWRLYNAYTAPATTGKYKYTTLKDTIKYMKKNGPSVISYEEALKDIESGEL